MSAPRPRAPLGAVEVLGLDHLVLCVADVERALAFWHGELGLPTVREAAWRAGTVPFVSVRIDDTTIIDLVAADRTGENVDHVCVVLAPTDLDALVASGRFDVVRAPSRVFGAQGHGWAIYVRDPDGNVVELRHYGATANG